MRKILAISATVIGAILLGLYIFREPVLLRLAALKAGSTSLDAQTALMSEGFEVRLPEGAGPFPVALLLHGCAGPRPDTTQWSSVVLSEGYAAALLDSHGPRGIDRAVALDEVCTGKRLIGQERTRDVLAALELLKRDPALDTSRVVLAGWSHGAWTIMDLFAMNVGDGDPLGFAGVDPDALEGVEGAILFYPYCGFGAYSHRKDWTHAWPTLALVAEDDTIVDSSECITTFDRLKASGEPIDVTVYPGVNHVFDLAPTDERDNDWYDPEASRAAEGRVREFLRDRKK